MISLLQVGALEYKGEYVQDMFPDVVRKFYVINAPTFIQVRCKGTGGGRGCLQILYKMISPVIAKQTTDKLRILGSDYKEILRVGYKTQ